MEKDLNRHSSSILNFNKNTKFALKLLLLLVIIGAYIAHLIPQYGDSYNASLIDKVDRLKSINEPKIVLIGNSNVAFGFDSAVIEEAMGMPVVNMGIHGGMGNKFHDDMMDYNVTPGDIYIVNHVSYWRYDHIESPLLAWTTFENNTELWHLVKKSDYSNMYHSFSAYVKKLINRRNNFSTDSSGDGENAYVRQAFNEYGDVAVHREAIYADYSADIYPPSVDAAEADALNEWKKYLEERGATLLIAGFPICIDQWPEEAGEEYMDNYQTQLEDMMDCDVISNWRDYCFANEYFYDTPYHLTDEGARLRSEQLVRDLEAWKAKQ